MLQETCFWVHGKLLRFDSQVSAALDCGADKKDRLITRPLYHLSLIFLYNFQIEIYQLLHLSIYKLIKNLQICHYLVKLLILVLAIYLHLSINSKAKQLVIPSYISSRFQSGVAAVSDKAVSIISPSKQHFDIVIIGISILFISPVIFVSWDQIVHSSMNVVNWENIQSFCSYVEMWLN